MTYYKQKHIIIPTLSKTSYATGYHHQVKVCRVLEKLYFFDIRTL